MAPVGSPSWAHTVALPTPSGALNADLNVPLDLHVEQLNTGFGSVWVSQKYGNNVVRVDPDSGEVLATIEVGTEPLKLQPADGRMWVRTADEYVAIDPDTNTVTDTLRKADVGSVANRNYAVDGPTVDCDGRQLHRYDPTLPRARCHGRPRGGLRLRLCHARPRRDMEPR